jgi:hypothetical protein
MSNPSNLYAEKIYAEHPMAFWALDDQADYISLIEEEQRFMDNWEVSEGTYIGTFSSEFKPSDTPFPESCVTQVIAGPSEGQFGQVVCISEDIANFSSLNKNLSTFSVGAFIKPLSVYTYSFDIGYEYYDTVSGSTIQRLKTYVSAVQDKWIFISETTKTIMNFWLMA